MKGMTLRETAVEKVNLIFRLNSVAMVHLQKEENASAYRKL
jgi:hypothetical protein